MQTPAHLLSEEHYRAYTELELCYVNAFFTAGKWKAMTMKGAW